MNYPLSDDLRAGFADGSLPEAFDLVLATHLSLQGAAGIATLGGAMLEATEPVAMADGALDAALGRIRQSKPKPKKEDLAEIFPEPLRSKLGADAAFAPWQVVSQGVQEIVLPAEGNATARLFSVAPGHAIPAVGGAGKVVTLVLQGAYAAGDSRFVRGDIAEEAAQSESGQVAEPGDPCICLVAAEHG
ncbi:MAG: transcriptional regulator [Pseudomonadota bacterium]